jgi:uncharacterized membrane protein
LYMILLQAAESSNALVRMAEPWNKLFSHSKIVSAAVLFFHLVPLLIAGGTAIVADRATLRATRGTAADRARQLAELAGTHRFIISGLTLSLVSGILLFLSDVEAFLPSPFFWVKLTLIVLLLANGFLMTRTERLLSNAAEDVKLWARMRTISILSVVLWLATTLAGVTLSQFA